MDEKVENKFTFYMEDLEKIGETNEPAPAEQEQDAPAASPAVDTVEPANADPTGE